MDVTHPNANTNANAAAADYIDDDDDEAEDDYPVDGDADGDADRAVGGQRLHSWKPPSAFQRAHAEASEKEGELRKATSTMLFYKTLETEKADTVRRQKQRMQQQEDENAGDDCGLFLSGKSSNGKAMYDDSDCTICLSSFSEGDFMTLLECGHSFCSNCIKDWYKQCLAGNSLFDISQNYTEYTITPTHQYTNTPTQYLSKYTHA